MNVQRKAPMMKIATALLVLLSASPLFGQAEGVDRFLVPLYVDQPLEGAYGSLWVTEFSVVNDSEEAVYIYGWDQVCPILCTTEPAPPHVTFYPSLAFWATGVQGIYVEIPRESVASVSMHLRIRDISRPAISWGAEVPVVHESRARRVIRLLDIPTDSRYRQHLRIYDLTPSEGAQALVRVYGVKPETKNPIFGGSPGPDRLLYETHVAFALPFGGLGTEGHPGFAELPLTGLYDAQGFTRVRVQVEAASDASRIWAFMSLTNNETQQVSVVSPE